MNIIGVQYMCVLVVHELQWEKELLLGNFFSIDNSSHLPIMCVNILLVLCLIFKTLL